jgi:hypothetical protein
LWCVDLLQSGGNWHTYKKKTVGRIKLPIPGVAVAETCELLAFAVDIEP